MSTTIPDILTTAQAADYLQVDSSTIYRLIREGRLSASRIGRGYRITRRSLDWLLVDQRVRADIPIREYGRDQIAEFVERDRLGPEAIAIVRGFDKQAL